MGAALLTTVLFSFSAIFANRTSRMMGGTEANFWRLCFATVFLGIFSFGWGIGLQGAAFPLFFASGVVGFGVADLALFQALPRLGSRLTMMLMHCLAAPFASVIEYCWLGTTLTPREIICGATILAGVSLALSSGQHLHVARRILFAGIAFGTLAAFGQGFGAVISRKAYAVAAQTGQHTQGVAFGVNAAFQRIVGGVILSGIFLLIVKRVSVKRAIAREPGGDPKNRWKPVLPWLLLNALVGPTLGVSCYQWALSELPTGIVLPIVALTPLTVIPLSVTMEQDRFTVRSLVGAIIAVAGVVALKIDPGILGIPK